MRALVAVLALAATAAAASAGSAEAPELTDLSGDGEVPYCNAYLDIASAWVDGEDEDSFVAHLQLAAFEPALSPGSGMAVTFEHQGARYGVIAADLRPIEQAWGFWSGTATEDSVDTYEEAPGSFDEATGHLAVEFPKWLFPHADAADRNLTGFLAFTADIRPYLAFGFTDVADGQGTWIVCDTAEGTGTYTFNVGGHSGHEVANVTANGAPAAAASLSPASSEPTPATTAPENATPGIGLLAVGGATALVAATRRR